jgi:hypothetical protein
MSSIKEGDWVLTKSNRIAYVAFEDTVFKKNNSHMYLYFFGNDFHCRSYKTNSLTKVEPAIAKMLTDVHKEQIKTRTSSFSKTGRDLDD